MFVGHVVCEAIFVLVIHFIPVEAVFLVLVVEEAVLGVDGFPKGFEIALGGVVGDVFGDAGGEEECHQDCHPERSEGSREYKVDVAEILHFTSFRSDGLLRTLSEK